MSAIKDLLTLAAHAVTVVVGRATSGRPPVNATNSPISSIAHAQFAEGFSFSRELAGVGCLTPPSIENCCRYGSKQK